MAPTDRARLMEDSTGRKKLKVSLPGGRYQLSLDDSGVILLRDRLGYDLRETVPDIIVRVLVATGDAWFPHQKDYRSVLEDLPDTGAPTEATLSALADHLRSTRVPEARISVVREVVRQSALADRVDPDEIEVKELPSIPSGVFEEESAETGGASETESASGTAEATGATETTETAEPDEAAETAGIAETAESGEAIEATETAKATETAETAETAKTAEVTETAETAETTETAETAGATETTGTAFRSPDAAVEYLVDSTSANRTTVETRLERLVDAKVPLNEAVSVLERQFGDGPPEPDVFDVPGVGTMRGHNLVAAGLDSVERLAEMRPADLAETPNFSEGTATTVVEGARELLGYEESTADQLARQTDEPAAEFDAALAQLAAAGVPPSAAAPTLRTLYGPSIVEVDGVDGRMAYFLREAGYETPWELARATVEELQAVDYLGPTTAERVIENAADLIDS